MALRRPGCATLVISDDYRPEQKARLLKEGVADYLVRPINLRRLAYLIDVLTIEARHFVTSQAAEAACDGIKTLSHGEPFLYGPGEMEQIVAQAKTVAPLDTTILLCGETGTGKTRMAKLIHELSPRRSNPFMWVDCGALSWPLVESELFGHAKGSFTGADSSSPGKFARASGGTLMIDDIDNIPLELQSKFLRAVDERVYEPVGGTRQLPLTARLIVTTNKSLKQEVDEGRFRSDLYYRINVISFRLPPLRERREMIPVLATSFAKDVARRQNRTPPVFSEQAMQDLQAYDWPGNVRELRNTVERCVTLSTKSLIEADVFPEELRQQSVKQPVAQPQCRGKESSNWRQAKRDAEALALQNALNQSGNNRSVAARKLGISRVTLYKKLHEYDLF
jgi:DNA-binding NtrC family response regulator